MNTYKNTFEMFGDSAKCEADSARDFAHAYLPFFEKAGDQYRIYGLRASERVGWSQEIAWCDRVLAACHDVTGDEDPEKPASGLISEELLLDYLEEAVQED